MPGGGGSSSGNNGAPVRKGPWMADEDEILMEYVRKHGPRDWSSIRSKGLLLRTGKSCRLRWVNKLQPHLKTGCKFTAEEERIVIDLQARFGNKWARIATYLPGRTDNDVKNFWSTRQKRLARLLQTPLPRTTSSNSSHKHNNNNADNNNGNAPVPVISHHNIFPQLTPIDQDCNMNIMHFPCKREQCSSGASEQMALESQRLNIEATRFPFPGLVAMHQPWPLNQLPFQRNLNFPLLPESSEIISGLGELGLFQEEFPLQEEQPQSCMSFYEEFPSFSVEPRAQQFGMKTEQISTTEMTTDNFFDEFPVDMFDNVPEPPPDSLTSQAWS